MGLKYKERNVYTDKYGIIENKAEGKAAEYIKTCRFIFVKPDKLDAFWYVFNSYDDKRSAIRYHLSKRV